MDAQSKPVPLPHMYCFSPSRDVRGATRWIDKSRYATFSHTHNSSDATKLCVLDASVLYAGIYSIRLDPFYCCR